MRFLSLAGWCPAVGIIIVFIAGDAVRQLVCDLTPLPSGAQLNDGTVNASCFAVMMLRYLIWKAVF